MFEELNGSLRGFFLLLPDLASLRAILRAIRVALNSRRVPRLASRPRHAEVVRAAHRSVRCGRAQQPRRAVLQQGDVRGGGGGVHEGARARPEDAGRAAQSRGRVLQHGLLRPPRRRAARAAALSRPDDRDARWELGRAYALLGQSAEAVAEFTALLRHHPERCRRGRAARSRGEGERRSRHGAALVRARDPRSSRRARHALLSRRGALQSGAERGSARSRCAARSSSIPTIPTRTFCSASCYGDMGRHEEARAATQARDRS